jgi:putative ABC transport system permease protein
MLQDLRFSIRQSSKNPGFTIIAVLTLALAIGATTAIFSAADAVLLHPLPYPDPDQLVIVQENLPGHGLKNVAPQPEDFDTFRREATCFSRIAAMIGGDATLTGDGPPEDVPDARISAGTFPMLGIVPILGSLFTSDDEQLGKNRVAVLSETLWRRRYAADRSIIGRNIQVDRLSYRVAGVVRMTSLYRAKAELWLPLAFAPVEIAPGTNGPHYVNVIGRLKPGVTIENAREEFRAIAARLVEQYLNQVSLDRGFAIEVSPLAERQAGDLRMPMLVLLAAVGALMLIACANVSNLLLARGVMRWRELGIRAALGATRTRLLRLLLAESLLLALAAGSAGTLLAFGALRLFAIYGPGGLIRGTQPSMNGWVMFFSIGISLAATVFFGLAPALAVSRVDITGSLKEGSRGSTTGRRLLRESMVALEIAASFVLLIATGLLGRSFVKMAHEDPGFRFDHVLTAIVSLPPAQYRTPAQRIAFAGTLLERARALPGVDSAATVDIIPYYGGAGSALKIPGDPNPPGQVVRQTRASPGLFQTLGIPLLSGRDFVASDEQAPGAAIIDQNVARLFFPNRDPIGRGVTLGIAGGTFPIVGVVGAIKSQNLAAPPLDRLYYLGPQSPIPTVAVIVRTKADPLALSNAIRREIAALDPDLPVTPETMEQVVADSLSGQRFSIQLMGVFAALASSLAAIGIYGVLAYLVDQRRREFSIRMALGARTADVIALVLRQASIPIALGILAGGAGSLALTRLLKALLYEVSPTDPFIFGAVSFGLIVVSIAAMLIPARNATRVDPLSALRQE